MRGWLLLAGGLLVGCGASRKGAGPWEEQGLLPCPVEPVQSGSLRAEAEAAGLSLGVAVDLPRPRRVSAWDAVLREQFGGVTPEWVMKWAPLQPDDGVWDFSRVDPLVVCAVERGQRVKGHALTWYQAVPPWLDEERVEVEQHLVDHLDTTVRRYRDRVLAWDVINEVLDDEGRIRDELLTRELGPQWMDLAFETTHAAAPGARLLYNETGIARLGPKQDSAAGIVEGMLGRGVPVHGVGLQLHQAGTHPVGPTELRAALGRFAELGLAVARSERDVTVVDLAGGPELWDQAAAVIVGESVAACVEEPACDAVTFWGLSDAESWLRQEPGGRRDRPLLYDRRFEPKAAVSALRGALAGRRPAVCPGGYQGPWTGLTGGEARSGEEGLQWVGSRTEAWQGPSLDLGELVDSEQIWQVRTTVRASEHSRVLLTLRVRADGEDHHHRLGAVEVGPDEDTVLEAILALPAEAEGAEELVVYLEGPEPGVELGTGGVELAPYCVIEAP